MKIVHKVHLKHYKGNSNSIHYTEKHKNTHSTTG